MKLSRRSLIGIGTAAATSSLLSSCGQKAPAPKNTPPAANPASKAVESKVYPFIPTTDSSAQNINYVEASKADPKARVKRGETEGKDQFCKNCQFYVENKALSEAGGSCQLLPNWSVKADYWCSSWVLKA